MRVFTIALALLLGAPLAQADNVPLAKARFETASKHYDLGEYQAALDDFKEGYRYKADPVFLYNIAQCHRALQHHTEALTFYRAYLRKAPHAENREDVEAKVVALQQAIADEERAAREAAAKPPEPKAPEPVATPTPAALEVSARPPAKRPVYKRWWFWTAIGGGVVAIGLGVGLGIGLTRSHQTNFPQVTF